MVKTQIIYGIHAVTAALKSGKLELEQIWLLKDRRDSRLDEVRHLAQSANLRTETADRATLDQMVEGAKHQGVVATYRANAVQSEDQLKDYLQNLDSAPLVLALDGVQDPHNLGACLRTADAAGVCAVIAPKDNAVAITPVVRKVACGAAEFVPFVPVTNLSRTLRWMKDLGIWLVGLEGEAEQSLYQIDLKGPLCVVMGAEGKGLRRLTREHCDFLAHIPMAGQVESLNVSVATGICLFEAGRQRGN